MVLSDHESMARLSWTGIVHYRYDICQITYIISLLSLIGE